MEWEAEATCSPTEEPPARPGLWRRGTVALVLQPRAASGPAGARM